MKILRSAADVVIQQTGAIPESWTSPWQGRVQTAIAGVGELDLDSLVRRTSTLVDKFSSVADLG